MKNKNLAKKGTIIAIALAVVIGMSYFGSKDYLNQSIMDMLMGDTSVYPKTVGQKSVTPVECYLENGGKMMKVNVKWQVYDNNGQPYCVSGVEVLEDVDYDQKGWTSLGATDSDGIVNDPISDTWESRATRTYTQWVKVSGRPDEDKTTKNRKWTCSETWSTPSGCATFE